MFTKKGCYVYYNIIFTNRGVLGSIKRPTLSHFSASDRGAKSFNVVITSCRERPDIVIGGVLKNLVNLASNLRL